MATANRRAALSLPAVAALVPALVLWALVTIALGPAFAAIPAVVLWVALGIWLNRGAPQRIVTRLGGAPADPDEYARLHNLVDNLCITGGISKPNLLVLPTEAINAMPVGRGPRQASVAVTAGAVSRLSRVELEGLMAHCLVRIRAGDVGASTAAVAVLGAYPSLPMVGSVLQSFTVARLGRADLAAIGLTRYPPGLAGALAKVAGDAARPAPLGRSIDLLWAVPPGRDGELSGRIQALNEL